MQFLSRAEFLKCGGIADSTFKVMQHHDHVALAFGVPWPSAPDRFLKLDLVAMTIASEMTQSLTRRVATDIVLTFWDVWLDAVGRADWDETTNYFFAVGAIGPRTGPPREFIVTGGRLAEIAKDFEGLSGFRLVTTNVTQMLARVRARGQLVGVNLDDPFFFKPDTDEYNAAIMEGEEIRKLALARFKQRSPLKHRRHVARARKNNMRPVERLKA
jgi:hypothetical protein